MNTTRNAFIVLLGIIIVIVGGTLLWQHMDPSNPLAGTDQTASTTPVTATTTAPVTAVFQSPELGFSFSYPASFSVAPQNFMDTTSHKTLVILKNADGTQRITVSVLLDPKTGKPVSPDSSGYEKSLINDVVFDGSGAHPTSFSAFESRNFGTARFAYIKNGLFEGTFSATYYAATPNGIVKFVLVSQGVDWTNPQFDPEQDAGHLALKGMLATFRVGAYSAVVPSVSYAAFQDPAGAYSLNAPAGWAVNKNFSYSALGPNVTLKGTAFMVPAIFTEATNLSADSYISVEKNPTAAACTADEFVSTGSIPAGTKTVTINGISWSKGESGDAGAGNLYDETVYSAKDGSDCYGVRLFLHSVQVANFDGGARQEFSKPMLDAVQAAVLSSFRFTK